MPGTYIWVLRVQADAFEEVHLGDDDGPVERERGGSVSHDVDATPPTSPSITRRLGAWWEARGGRGQYSTVNEMSEEYSREARYQQNLAQKETHF